MCHPACSPLLGSGAGALQPWGEGAAPRLPPFGGGRGGARAWELAIPRSLESELCLILFGEGGSFSSSSWVTHQVGTSQGLGTACPLCSLCLLYKLPPSPQLPQHPQPVGQQSPHWPTPQVYVLKRPHVDEFLQRMGELFECVLFTASLAKVSLPSSEGFLGQPCSPLRLQHVTSGQ